MKCEVLATAQSLIYQFPRILLAISGLALLRELLIRKVAALLNILSVPREKNFYLH